MNQQMNHARIKSHHDFSKNVPPLRQHWNDVECRRREHHINFSLEQALEICHHYYRLICSQISLLVRNIMGDRPPAPFHKPFQRGMIHRLRRLNGQSWRKRVSPAQNSIAFPHAVIHPALSRTFVNTASLKSFVLASLSPRPESAPRSQPRESAIPTLRSPQFTEHHSDTIINHTPQIPWPVPKTDGSMRGNGRDQSLHVKI